MPGPFPGEVCACVWGAVLGGEGRKVQKKEHNVDLSSHCWVSELTLGPLTWGIREKSPRSVLTKSCQGSG